MGAGIAATGAIREMNPEQILSRIYSIQRQVVSPRYVAGEITVQTMRRKKQEMFKQLLTDKRTPQVVLDVLQGQEGIFNKPDKRPANPYFTSGPCAKRPGWRVSVLSQASLGRSHRAKNPKSKLKIPKSKIQRNLS